MRYEAHEADTGYWGRDYQVKSCHKKFTPSSHSRWQDRKARAQPCCTQQATFQGSPPCLQTVFRWQRMSYRTLVHWGSSRTWFWRLLSSRQPIHQRDGDKIRAHLRLKWDHYGPLVLQKKISTGRHWISMLLSSRRASPKLRHWKLNFLTNPSHERRNSQDRWWEPCCWNARNAATHSVQVQIYFVYCILGPADLFRRDWPKSHLYFNTLQC